MHTIRLLVFGAGISMLDFSGFCQSKSTLVGHWEGKIAMGNHDLPVLLDFDRNPRGEWIGSISITGSTTVDVPLTRVTFEDRTVRFQASLPMPATFEGRVGEDGAAISGSASNSEGSVAFQLTRKGEAHVKAPAPSSPLTKEFEGAWEGEAESGGAKRKIGLKLVRGTDGIALATLTVVEKQMEIPVTTVTIDGARLRLEARVISGVYSGTLGANGEISGEWTEPNRQIPLTFRRATGN
jgi:hypothetical protein